MCPDPPGMAKADVPIPSTDIETTPTTTDLIEVYQATNQNIRKAISLANLFANCPDIVVDAIDADNIDAETLSLTPTEYTASGAIDPTKSYVGLDTASGLIAMTIAAPVAGQLMIITQVDTGTDGHTVTITSGDYDGTNDIATFNAAEETLILFGLSATRYVIIENIGGVALSAS